jgi:arginase
MIPVVVVPYHLAHRDFEVGAGAAKMARSLQWLAEEVDLQGAQDAVLEGSKLRSRLLEVGGEVGAVAQTNTLLATAVRTALGRRKRVLVLAGNCSTATGALAGIVGGRTGVIWFDAHGDFNTPETTVSGTIEGMALAVATGGCHQVIRESAGLAAPISEDRVLLAGTRDLDPGEEDRLKESPVRIAKSAGWTQTNFVREAEKIRAASADVYLHLDLDAVDPSLSPGVSFQSPGGLTPQQILEAVEVVAGWPELRAATIANYRPDLDPEGVTLRLALRLAAILGRSA